MGAICVKPFGIKDSPEKVSLGSRLSRSRGLESYREKATSDIRSGSIDKRLNSVVGDACYEKMKKKREVSEVLMSNFSGILTIPKAVEGEQVMAGWPSWLVSVAGEAIDGWLPRRADSFKKLDKIGQGTYSNVYKARDLVNKKIVALKRVRFDNMDPESVKFMAREILILRRLDHPNVIKLEGLITSPNSCSLYLVFEYMEHDLTGLASLPGAKFTEPQIKCYMTQLLSGLDHCHSRGVLHRDIKGSNLLIDNDGILKIADFGLASFFDNRQDVTLTSRVVTLWYRPPELLLGATHYGVSVDLWSSGCILGELYAGKPLMPGRTEVEQLHKIFKLCGSPSDDYWRNWKLPHSTLFKPTQPYRRRIGETYKDFPATVLGLMETLLAVDPAQRGTAALALKSEFFTTEPYACDPSSLPKYPPSKEIDVKMRDEEARRRRGGGNGEKNNKESKGPKDPRDAAAPDTNAEQKKQGQPNLKSRREKPTPGLKDANQDMKHPAPRRESYSGPLVAGFVWANVKPGKKIDDVSLRDSLVPSQLETRNEARRQSVSPQEFGHERTRDRKDVFHCTAGPRHVDSGKARAKEPATLNSQNRYAYKGNKIHFSGPLVSSNMDQMLKDHDRHIQEAVRRTRLEKMRPSKVQAERTQFTANPMYVSSGLES